MSTALCVASKSNSNLPIIIRSLEDNEPSSPQGKVDSDTKSRCNTLVVHLDINETILVGDDAGGDTREDSLNKILAKSAFVQIPPGSDSKLGKTMDKDSDSSITPTHWWDGSVIGEDMTHVPPLYTGWKWPDGCCPYYRTSYKVHSKKFVHGHGKPYRPLYDSMQKELTFFPPNSNADGAKLPDIMSHLLPALFDTLMTISQRPEQNIRLVFRTFGTDLPQLAEAITAFSRGHHPDYPNFVAHRLEIPQTCLFRGRWRNGKYVLFQYYENTNNNNNNKDEDDPERCILAEGDDQVLQLLSSLPICGIQDDYHFWAANGWEPWAGKPVWISHTRKEHHVLLDDNIHNLENDSIASIREEQEDGTYRFLSGREIQMMQGIHLIRVPTLEPIWNRGWLLEQLDKVHKEFVHAPQE
jgi:hypothetical protein